jgi:putative copper export protein
LISSILNQFNEAADKRVDHIFWRLLQLLATIGVIIFIVVILTRLTRPKTSIE